MLMSFQRGTKKFPEDRNRHSKEIITVTQLIYVLMIVVWKETKTRNCSTIPENCEGTDVQKKIPDQKYIYIHILVISQEPGLSLIWLCPAIGGFGGGGASR